MSRARRWRLLLPTTLPPLLALAVSPSLTFDGKERFEELSGCEQGVDKCGGVEVARLSDRADRLGFEQIRARLDCRGG